MKADHVFLDDIVIPDRRRSVHPDKVAVIAESFEQIGQLSPIIVRHSEDGYVLVAGLHRVKAAERLRWSMIEARITDASDDECRLAEIDENLSRAELPAAEEATWLAARKDIWRRIGKTAQPVGFKDKPFDEYQQAEAGGTNCSTRDENGRFNGGDRGFASETAAATGKTKQHINRVLARAEKVAPDVLDAVKGTADDKGVVLDALAKASPEQQRAAVQHKKDTGKDIRSSLRAISTQEPIAATTDDDAVTVQFNRIIKSWNAAGPDARQKFREYIDQPIFDSTRAGSR